MFSVEKKTLNFTFSVQINYTSYGAANDAQANRTEHAITNNANYVYVIKLRLLRNNCAYSI